MCGVGSSPTHHFLVGHSIIYLIKAQPISDRVVRIKSPRNRHRLTYDTDNTLPLHDPVHTYIHSSLEYGTYTAHRWLRCFI